MASVAVPRPAQSTAPDPSVGTTLAATSTCPAGDVLVGGGGRVSVTGPGSTAAGPATAAASGGTKGAVAGGSGGVALESSYPLQGGGWRTVAVVTGQLTPGQSMTLRPYVLCGKH